MRRAPRAGRHTFDMGNYAQCVGGGFQYCLITVAGAVPFASCVPADCSQAIVSNMTSPIWEYIWALNPLAFALAEATSNVYPVSVVCGDNKQPMTAGRGVFIGFLVTLGAVILAATGIVVHQRYCVRASGRKPEKPPAHKSLSAKLLDCFALTSSVPSMLATGGDRSGHLSSLNGVRVFSMSLVILGHTLIFQAVRITMVLSSRFSCSPNSLIR
ncbi:MAG: hypothetical protein EOO65_01595 [Methanosarcinales archaeon]|nr:MAG: hypothetical protein EOO65_01595 [Methanosarcinales archaeon]